MRARFRDWRAIRGPGLGRRTGTDVYTESGTSCYRSSQQWNRKASRLKRKEKSRAQSL